MATGAMDREISGRVFWKSAFGQKVSDDEAADMHPIRRMYKPRPTPEEEREASGFAMDLMIRGLAELNRQRKY